ncbi:MAG: hypothetical protein QCI82_08085 [Candidatus Thermoplasmatota archaeon]|nr:hypothetical protein [Candidatus Thermoplasmatota archaeon]
MRISRWQVLTAILVVIIASSASYLLVFSNESKALASDDRGPNGTYLLTRTLRDDGFDVKRILTTPALLLDIVDPSEVLYISLGRGRPLTPTETQDLRKFHTRGGKALIAEDGGAASTFAGSFDIDYLEGQLYDERFMGSPDLVMADVNWRSFSGTMVMNRPSGMASSGGDVIARSGPSSWIDRNGNGLRDPENISSGEFPGSKILAISTDPDFRERGGGCVIFMSDPSLFTNEMIEQGDNREFLRFIASYLLPGGGMVLIDDSTHRTSGINSILQGALRGPVILTTDLNFKIVVGTLSTVILVAAVYLYDPPSKNRHTTYLNRSGLAQLIDIHLDAKSMTLLRKVILDRVRLDSSIAVEAFSSLSWDRLREMIGDDEIFEFVRGRDPDDPNEFIRRVARWSEE